MKFRIETGEIPYLRFFLVILLPFVWFGFCISPVLAQNTAKIFDGTYPKVGGYLEYLPDDYKTNPNQKYPILIFFHGFGQIGNGTSDIMNLITYGPPRLIQFGNWPSSFVSGNTSYKFIVISPQCSEFWSEADVNYAVHQTLSLYGSRVDSTRIYLTGLSAGGAGLWEFFSGNSDNGNLVAASVICAGASPWVNSTRVNHIVQSNLPIWAFHNSGDNIIPASNSYNWQSELNGAGLNPKMLLTIYNHNYHDCWTETYDTSPSNPNNIYSWLLGYTRTISSNLNTQNPQALAGSSSQVHLPHMASLDGSSSIDALGTIQSYSWTKVLGPPGDSIIQSQSAKSWVSFTDTGTYVYLLNLVDKNNNSASTNITIQVLPAPPPPVANAGSNQTLTLPALGNLDGSNSTDSSGIIQSYVWTQVSGPKGDSILSPDLAKTSVTFSTPGVYVFKLKVQDNNQNADSSTLTITVNPALLPPVANAGSHQILTLPAIANLDGSHSTDSSGIIQSYVWTQVSGPKGDSILSPDLAKTSVTFSKPGVYVFKLKVQDNNQNADSSTLTITVNPALLPPVANAGSNQTLTLPALGNLDGSHSTDSSGIIQSYVWTQVSGPKGDSILSPDLVKTSVTFSKPGVYVFKLKVQDNNQNTDSSTLTITVKLALLPPIAITGGNSTIDLPSLGYLDGSNSTSSNGGITSYSWTKISGPTGDLIQNSQSSKTSVSFLLPGQYVYQLAVLTSSGLTGYAYDTIRVKPGHDFYFYPNPVINLGTLFIMSQSSGSLDISVMDYSGRKILEQVQEINIPVNLFPINFTGVEPGLYIMRATLNGKIIGSITVSKK